ncbi:MAG: amidohydrolase [Anaerolineae bacterium]|nr:amidohydrolase [Anaerolineae bacterium]
MIIDAHLHLDLGPNDVVRKMLDRRLVDVVAISSLQGGAFPSLKHLQASNDHVLRWMEEYPDRVIGFAYVNPRLGEEGVRELQRCLDSGMKGVKLWISVLADDPRVDPLIEVAQEKGAVVLAHAWVKTVGQLPFESRPKHVANLARRFPKARFMLAHFGGEWEDGAKVARDCPNLWVDTSGSLAEADMVDVLVESVGVERVLFGTDNANLHYCLGKIRAARLSEDERELILSGNARRLFGV